MTAVPRAAGRIVLLLAALWASPPANAGPPRVTPPTDSAALRLYVPNQMEASVSVLDGAGRVIETVDLRSFGFSERAMPHQVVVAPDGSAWYITLVGDGVVAKFDRSNRLVGRTEVELPGMIVLDPVRDRIYVSRALRAVDPPRRLAVLRASDLELLEEPDIFVPRPHALTVDAVSGRVYAGSLSTDRIVSYDPATGRARVTRVEAGPNGFVGLAASPDGCRLVATTQIEHRLLAFDATDPDGLVAIAAVPVEAGPYDVAYSPDGRSVWFPNQRANAVTRVDTRRWTVRAVIRSDGLVEPHGVAITADSRTVFVTSHGAGPSAARDATQGGGSAVGPSGNGTVAVIDARTDSVRSITEVGYFAAAPGLSDPMRTITASHDETGTHAGSDDRP